MFKRLTALVLCLTLAMSLGAIALGEEAQKQQKIDRLTQLVQDYIAQEGYQNVTHDAQRNRFSSDFELDSALGECSLYVHIYDDMLAVRAVPPLSVPESYRDNMARFLTLANMEEYYSYFQMDYQTGAVICRSYILVEEVFPSLEEIHVAHYMNVLTLDAWGNGIARVAGGADPLATFEEIRDKAD